MPQVNVRVSHKLKMQVKYYLIFMRLRAEMGRAGDAMLLKLFSNVN
jgi:hypothetical protein